MNDRSRPKAAPEAFGGAGSDHTRNRAQVSIVLTVDVRVDADDRADLRRAAYSVPAGAHVRLICGDAAWFVDHEADLLASALSGAARVQIEGTRPEFLVSLRAALGGGR